MSDFYFYLLLIPVGLTAGFFSGLFGVGGGVIYVPVLQLLLTNYGIPHDQSIYISIATSLFAGTFTSAGASYNHFKINNINFKYALYFSIGSLVSSIILPKYILFIEPNLLKIFFLSVLLFTILRILALDKIINLKRKHTHTYFLPLFGVVIAAMSVSTGLGGGVLVVPMFYYLFSIDIKKAIGTSSLIIFITMLTSSISYSFISTSGDFSNLVLFKVGLMLGLFAIIGSVFGVKVIAAKSSELVKILFTLFLIGVVVTSFASML